MLLEIQIVYLIQHSIHRDRPESRDKSPRPPTSNENADQKSLQERLWEMANGKPAREDKRDEFPEQRDRDEARDEQRTDRPPLIDRVPARHDGPPPALDGGEFLY